MTVDEGNVGSFVSAVAALPVRTVSTAVLDTGTGFTATTAAGLQAGFSYASLASAVARSAIGFSAAAEDNSSETLWLTRIQTSSTYGFPTYKSVQQGASAQGLTATAIANIGEEFAGLNLDQTQLGGSGVNAQSYPSGDNYSYQTQGEGAGTPNIITYNATQPTAAPAGGAMESTMNGSATIYEALWEVPVSGTGSDTYEGYFTFQTDGEVDFTTTAVPEPSTYILLALTGLGALAFRRQLRALIA